MFALGRRTPTVLIVSGVLALIFGIVAMVWPVGAAISMVIIWASYALVDGISALVLAFRPEGKEGKGFLIFSGIMGIIAGLVGLFMPVSSAVALAWVLGIWLLARGILEIGAAFGHERATPRWLLVVGGILWVLAGVLFINNPGAAAVTISLWVGVLAAAWGIVLIGAGISMRSRMRTSA